MLTNVFLFGFYKTFIHNYSISLSKGGERTLDFVMANKGFKLKSFRINYVDCFLQTDLS